MILKGIDRRRQPALGVANELDAILLSSHVGPSASTPQAQEQQLEKLLHLLRFSSTCLGS